MCVLLCGDAPVQCRMNAVWLTSESFYSVAVWLLESAWMSNYTTRCPTPSSCVSCVIEYCYWTGHSRTLDSAPLLWDSELALDLWSVTRGRVRLGASRGRSRNQASVSHLKKKQTFHWITTLQWQRGKLFVGDRKQNKPWDWSVLYCHLAATSAVDVTTDDKNNLNSLHGPHLVSPLV